MNLKYYPYFTSNDFKDYEFYSEGPKGRIRKAIRFTKIDDGDSFFYNLGFGDIFEETDVIDDTIVSDNGDRDIVLATVAKTVIDFTNIHGNHDIFAIGSSAVRTRLYQISISRLWDEISNKGVIMSEIKKTATEKGHSGAIVSDKVKDRSNDPYFVKKAEEAKEFMRKHPLPEHLKK